MYESFREGSIISLKLENFQTYTKAEFSFHPNLNFIAGPNGSGKSSIANAIAFIFCGSPATIGKTKDITEYVNFNAMEAKVEALIKYQSNFYTLKRILRKDTKKTKWFINNEEKKQHEYSNFIFKLGITIDNLCMFLPQEKVSEFSGLSPEELLIHTLESQSDKSILQEIEKLKKCERHRNDLLENIALTRKNKEGIGEIVENLEKDIKKLQEKKNLEEKVKSIKIKKHWMNYELIQEEYKKINRKLEIYKKEISEKEEEIKKIENKIKEIMNSEKMKELEKEKGILEKMNESFINEFKKIKKEFKSIELLEIDKRSLESKKESRKNEVEHLKRKIADAEKKISSIKIEEIKRCAVKMEEIEKLREEILELQMNKSSLERKSYEIKKEYELLQIKKSEYGKEENRRMEYLEKYHPDTFKAVNWLRRNKDKFTDEIIEPPILSLKIKDNRFIKEVETFLSFQILSPFICKNKNDFELFIKILKEENKLGINVLEEFSEKKRNILSKEQLNALGFEAMLIDLIEAREEIINMLNTCGHFYAIPITKNAVDEEKIFSQYENIKRMAAKNKFIEIKRSFYNKNDFVISEVAIKGINLLSSFSNEGINELNLQIKNLDEKRKENYEEHKNLVVIFEEKNKKLEKMNKIIAEQNEIITEMERRKYQRDTLIRNTENYKIQIQSLAEFSDLEKENEEINEKIKEIKQKIKEKSKEFNDFLENEEIYEQFKKIKELESEISQKNSLISQEKNKKLQINAELNDIQLNHKETLEYKKEKGVEMDKFKERLKKYPLDEQLKKKFNDLPQTISELEDMEAECLARIQFYDCDTSLEDDYKKKEADLRTVMVKLTSLENKYDTLEEQTNLITNEIKNKIDEFIKPLNNKFSSFFRKFNCEGKIEFEEKNLDSYKWKLNIFVKFRENEKLELLTAFRQSGGEKSLTTILFLLALQSISPAPFRLVDEINQGMDRFNEKMVHNTLVSLCDVDSPQFFIITPKIVPELEFSENMKVHIVFSGNFLCEEGVMNNYKIKCMNNK